MSLGLLTNILNPDMQQFAGTIMDEIRHWNRIFIICKIAVSIKLKTIFQTGGDKFDVETLMKGSKNSLSITQFLAETLSQESLQKLGNDHKLSIPDLSNRAKILEMIRESIHASWKSMVSNNFKDAAASLLFVYLTSSIECERLRKVGVSWD
jgi:GTPase Era involved in 16S rRNA processing